MLVTPGVPLLGAFMFNAIYKMDAYSFKCTGVFTTKIPTDAYRGAGRPEATYAIEHAMDDLAAELGVDPLELRKRNWITHEEFPYTTIAGLTYDSGNYEAATAKAVELFGYDDLRKEQAERRASGDPVQLGIGISTFTEMCGLAPSRVLGALAYGAGGWEHAAVRMLPTGKVEVVTGSSAHGQGHETAWSQIVADQLGVPFEDIRVLHGDTRSRQGHGHLRVALAGGRRHRRGRRVREGGRQGQGDRGGPARGLGRRPGVDAGPVVGARRPGTGRDDRRDRAGHVRGAQPAGRRGAVAGLRGHLRPGQLLLPARHAPVRGRGGHRDRAGEDPLVRGGGRRGRGGEPAHRRGPGTRRHRPGHRAGAVRGGRLRRRRQPADHHAGGLPAAVRRRTCRRS